MYSRWLLTALVALLVVVRVSAPLEFFSSDQLKQVGYVMDILHGGDLSIQYEVHGPIATKPPLYNWISAAIAVVTGSTGAWVMMLPSLLAAVGLLAIVYALGARLLTPEAGFWAVLAFGASNTFFKLMWFARTDMLMTFGLYLAVYLVYRMPMSWAKAGVIGGVLAADFLVKGPIGPPIFALWLLLWAWHEGALGNRAAYPKIVLGTMIPLVVAGVWLAMVWNKPQFQETVIQSELIDRVSGEDHSPSPFYGYVPLFFARTAPWCLLAIYAVVAARRQPEWRTVRFLALWALLIFVFFSAVPSKRADRLLPTYPPVFLLAGLGVDYLVRERPVAVKRAAVVVGMVLVAAPLLVPLLVMPRTVSLWVWTLTGGATLCGIFALAFARQSRAGPAMCAVIAGLLFVFGLDKHGVVNEDERADAYADLRAFAEPLRDDAADGRVLVWDAEPMISYELGLHQRGADPAWLETGRFAWLVTRSDNTERLRTEVPCALSEKSHLSLPRHRGEISLFRIGCPTLGSTRTDDATETQ